MTKDTDAFGHPFFTVPAKRTTKARDTQRAKLYKAERILDCYMTEVETVADVERLVRRIESSKRVRAKYPSRRWLNLDTGATRGVKVHDGRGHRRAVSYGGMIAIPRWARKDWVVLHEMAHELVRPTRQTASHGWEFAACYLYLVKLFMGREAHDALRAAFKAHRVRYTKPRKGRTLTQEEREAMAARLSVYRASAASEAA